MHGASLSRSCGAKGLEAHLQPIRESSGRFNGNCAVVPDEVEASRELSRRHSFSDSATGLEVEAAGDLHVDGSDEEAAKMMRRIMLDRKVPPVSEVEEDVGREATRELPAEEGGQGGEEGEEQPKVRLEGSA